MSMGSIWASIPDGDCAGHLPQSSDIDRVVTELAGRFPAVSPETLRTVVTDEFQEFDGAAISTFVPVLVAKAAAARLRGNGSHIGSTLAAGRPDEGPAHSAGTGAVGGVSGRPERSVNVDGRAANATSSARNPASCRPSAPEDRHSAVSDPNRRVVK